MERKGIPVIPRPERIRAIVKQLPLKCNGVVLRQIIKSTVIRGTTVQSRQSIDSYVNTLKADGWLIEQPTGQFRQSKGAREPGEIRVYVRHSLLVERVMQVLEDVVSEIDGIKIEEVKQNGL